MSAEEEYNRQAPKLYKDLAAAVARYHEALEETNKCTELLLSRPYRGDEAGQIMQNMYQAQSDMFKLIGINYHGGTASGKREDDNNE